MFSEKYHSVLEQYEKFWNRTNTERPILNISYPASNESYRAPATLEEQWLDETYRYNAFKHGLDHNGYLAEGIPTLFTNFGPGCLSACIGGGYELSKRTIWFDTKLLVDDWENPPEICFDEQSEMWQNMLRAQKLFASDPDVHFSIPDLGGILDIVASWRGTQNLLYDLYDYPDEVKEFASKVKETWFKAFDKQLEIVSATGQPYNTWMNIPSAKPWYPIQCDFAYMISPDQFREFALPDIVDMVNYMERSIYHLDGVGELPHVDMLLDIPNLNGIQWVAGDGHEPLTDPKWYELYKKIQNKKKNIVLLGGLNENDMAGAERLIKSIDPTGVCISWRCSSREKAEDMLEKITLWSK